MAYKTSDNNYGTAKWIVDATAGQGSHTTIASALTDASSGDTIFIRPGTFTENLTLKAGVNLAAYSCDAYTPNVTIVGKCSYSSAGSVSISGIRLKTNSDFFLSVTGSAASIVNLSNCFLEVANNTGIQFTSSSSSAEIKVAYCTADTGTTGISYFTDSSSGTLSFVYCECLNTGASSTASTKSAGLLNIKFCTYRLPVTYSSSNSNSNSFCSLISTASTNSTFLTTSGTGTFTINQSNVATGTATSISVGSGTSVNSNFSTYNSSNASVVSGSGTFSFTCNAFSGTSDVVSSTTVNTGNTVALGQPQIANAVYVLSNSGSPSGSVTAAKGSMYLRTDGSSSSTRAYSNTNSGTTWTSFTTAS